MQETPGETSKLRLDAHKRQMRRGFPFRMLDNFARCSAEARLMRPRGSRHLQSSAGALHPRSLVCDLLQKEGVRRSEKDGKEYDLADKNQLAAFLEDADIQLVPRAGGGWELQLHLSDSSAGQCGDRLV